MPDTSITDLSLLKRTGRIHWGGSSPAGLQVSGPRYREDPVRRAVVPQ